MNVDQTDLFNDETKLSGSSWRYIYFEFGSTHCELPKKIPFSWYSVLFHDKPNSSFDISFHEKKQFFK